MEGQEPAEGGAAGLRAQGPGAVRGKAKPGIYRYSILSTAVEVFDPELEVMN